ncbi:MAG: PHP domain-containing protein [Candidatus Methanomethylicaceae archaeon]|jgi:predicted metal-dependent phosphoesterase TrpH
MRYDLHIHSKYSNDSISTPDNILKIAKKKGLNGIAITDHNTIKGGLETKKIKTENLEIIVGAEIKTELGDIIGLFLNEEIKSRTFDEVLEEISTQGGITILPHPYRHHRLPEYLARKVDAIEIFNARSSCKQNAQCSALIKTCHKPITAGSDAHMLFEIGRGLTISEDCIENALKKGMTSVIGTESNHYFGHSLSFILEKIKGKNHE